MVKKNGRILKLPWSIIGFILLLISCQENLDLPAYTDVGTWEYYNTSNGLPGNSINDIKLDSKGNLWVAFSGAGVGMFDGSSWTSYNVSNSDILSNNISCIEEDDNGDMWFGTTNGISFLREEGVWDYFQDPNTSYNIRTIKKDSNGWVWVGTRNNSYFAYNYSDFLFATLSSDPDINRINTIEEDNYGNIWLGTNAGLFKWNWQAWSYQDLYNILETNEVWSLYCDSNNRIWIGTSGGLMAAYSKNNNITLVETLNGGISVYIRDIFEDRHGDIWLATWYDGVIRHNGIYSEIFRENNGFPEEYVEAIAEDSDGNIWIGTDTEGIAKYILPVKTKF